ncbi:putative SPARK domain-containing protein [Helianthus anomalus]
MNFNYVLQIPWHTVDCRHSATSGNPITLDTNSTTCCQTLLSVFGISLAHYLKTTSYLNLPDLATYMARPTDFQSKLNILKLPINLATFYFVPVQFKQLLRRSSAKIFHFARNKSKIEHI